MSALSIRCLGKFELIQAGGAAVSVPAEKNRLLLVMVALARGHSLDRSELIGALWGDRGAEQARGSLRQALWSIRKDLGPLAEEVLERQGQRLHLNAIDIDVARFEAAVAEGGSSALARALELYRGDLLEEFDLAGLDDRNTLMAERHRLRDLAIQSGRRLAEHRRGVGDLAGAVEAAQRAVAIDSLQEDLHRLLIGLYRDSGQSGLAVKQYQTCRDALAELGVAPSDETEKLRRSLPGTGARRAPHRPPRAPLSPQAPRPDRRVAFWGGRKAAALSATAALVFVAGFMVSEWTEPPTGRPHLAVMPFEDMSVDRQQAIYAAGLTADIITDLAKLSGIEVIARDSVRDIRPGETSVLDVAKALKVDYVLRGNVRRTRGQIRINAQLIDGETGQHVWAERYDQDAERMFEVQDNVIQQVAAALSIGLSDAERAALARIPTTNLEAYDHFLRAEYQPVDIAGTEGRHAKLDAYLKAIALDPDFAEAYAGYARALVDIWRLDMTDVMSSTVAKSEAYAAANDALRIDARNARALTALAMIQISDGQYGAAVASARNAAAIAPGSAEVQTDLAVVLALTGDGAAAQAALDLAHGLNPAMPPSLLVASGIVAFEDGRFDEALGYLERALAEVPTMEWANVLALAAYGQTGNRAAATRIMARLLEAFPIANLSYYEVARDQMRIPVQTPHLLEGLRLAGLAQWPYGVAPDAETLVEAAGLDDLVVGRTWIGVHHSGTPFLQENTASGKYAYRSDLSLRTGTIGIEGGRVCETSDGNLPSGKSCGVLHRGGPAEADYTLLMPESARYFRIAP
jgi:adenylate cyclase